MKYRPRNTAQNEAKKQPVFSEKVMGDMRIKLKQLAEIEFLIHTEINIKKRKKEIKISK